MEELHSGHPKRFECTDQDVVVSEQPTPGSLSCLGSWADPASRSLTSESGCSGSGNVNPGVCVSIILLFSVLKPLLDVFKPSECDSSASDKKHLDTPESIPKEKPILVSCIIDFLTLCTLKWFANSRRDIANQHGSVPYASSRLRRNIQKCQNQVELQMFSVKPNLKECGGLFPW